jgi:hypothetical protein
MAGIAIRECLVAKTQERRMPCECVIDNATLDPNDDSNVMAWKNLIKRQPTRTNGRFASPFRAMRRLSSLA